MHPRNFRLRRFVTWLCWAYAFKYLFTPVMLPSTLGSTIPLLPVVRVFNAVLDPFKTLVRVDSETIEELTGNLGVGLDQFKAAQLLDEASFGVALEGARQNNSFLGRVLTRHGSSTLLAMQWRVAQLVHEHPEILLEKVDQPLFLTGLARSGSTFLFQVLADADLGFRHVKFWESVGGPVPLTDLPPGHAGTVFDVRIRKAAAMLVVFKWLMPSISILHEWNSLNDPEEEVAWLGATFIDTTASITSDDVRMQQRAVTADGTLKYKLLKRILQCMQWEAAGRTGSQRPRWILKSPEHVIGVDALISEFPDAKIVAISRDAVAAFKSLLILKHHLSGLFITRPEVTSSRAWTELYVCRGLQGFKRIRESASDGVLLLNYSQVTGNTMKSVKDIIDFSGLEWSVGVEERVAVALKKRMELWKTKPRFEYDISDFGFVDDSEIAALLQRCGHILDDATRVGELELGLIRT
mmetsp:Transcript_66164/g.133284  ORF Transcript_66164/g.133284 Transcript_66164/m.133284 type:complete len:467 (+) Transcript_66164:290-1690(+)